MRGGAYIGIDGVINSGSELLGNMTLYGGAKGLPTGSACNCQQIPHRSQQVIPRFYLPNADKREPQKVKVCYAVDLELHSDASMPHCWFCITICFNLSVPPVGVARLQTTRQ